MQKFKIDLPCSFINIGGVSNITYIGEDDKLIAFDTGPGNAPINDFVRKKNRIFFRFLS